MNYTDKTVIDLTNLYIKLNKQFIKAIKEKRPTNEIEVLKEQIKTVFEQISIWRNR